MFRCKPPGAKPRAGRYARGAIIKYGKKRCLYLPWTTPLMRFPRKDGQQSAGRVELQTRTIQCYLKKYLIDPEVTIKTISGKESVAPKKKKKKKSVAPNGLFLKLSKMAGDHMYLQGAQFSQL